VSTIENPHGDQAPVTPAANAAAASTTVNKVDRHFSNSPSAVPHNRWGVLRVL
jgi:hypothetical protein